MAQTLTPTERTIRNARNVLTGGRWFLIAGLVFYSLMTTTPFVAGHSEWAWSGWVLGLIVDAAFIMALSAESTLAKYGIRNLGKWPLAFRWITGLSAVFLNVWASVEAKNPVGVAVHLIAPALVMLLAEVGPVYMAALAHAESMAPPAEPNEALREAAEVRKVVITAPPSIPAEEFEQFTEILTAAADPIDVAEDFAREEAAPTAKLSKAEADRMILEGWKHRETVSMADTAKAATRSVSTVSRRWKELDAEIGV
jgi:hypothetical protein